MVATVGRTRGLLLLASALLIAPSPTLHAQQPAKPYTLTQYTAAPDLLAAATTPPHTPEPASPTAVHYNIRFGQNPYTPSEAKSEFTGFLKPEDFPTAQYCSKCHAAVHSEWRESVHANSFRTPWYKKNVNLLIDTKGVEYSRHCEGCHNPVALFTGALTQNATVQRPFDEEGVTCMVCHSIKRVQSNIGLGSYVLGKPAVLVDEAGAPVPGMPSDADILAHLDRHKRAVMQPFYRTSEFCGTCHKANLPRTLNDYKWLRAFTTYDEWQQSSWSTETPLPYYTKPAASTCQTCHMPLGASADPSSKNHLAASHRWLGANTAIPAQYGFDEQAKRVADYLRDDKLTIDLFAVTIEHSATSKQFVAPLGSQPFAVAPGDWVTVDVVVRNKGIGHSLVPEQRDFYESWLDFSVLDDAGKPVYRSGATDANHFVDPTAHTYTTRLINNKSEPVIHHEVWTNYIKAYDATILPGRSDIQRYRFRIPATAHGVKIAAAVNYRRFNRTFSNWVFDDQPSAKDRFPTIVMASALLNLNIGDNKATAPKTITPRDASNQNPDVIRWNNYGIGMVDRQQFSEAVEAFSHTVQLDPTYQPGYVNVAIAEYSRGRYPEALAWLARATHLKPNDPRAQYYTGLCYRWQNKYDEAIATLQPVAARYPRFRQVHQDLGYAYLVRKRYAEARTEYETVLRIDPDDALAHRWLGPVYAALGDKTAAAAEATYTAQVRDDTSAGWAVQNFWRANLNIAEEAIPNHIHSQEPPDTTELKRMLNLQNPPSYIWILQH